MRRAMTRRAMTRRAWIAACCLVGCVGFLLAQEPAEGLITVPVQVADLDGVPVTDLEAKNFIVYESRKAVEIRTFAKAEEEGNYVLTYAPAANADAGFRPIEVHVNRPNLHVRARAGYYPAAAQ